MTRIHAEYEVSFSRVDATFSMAEETVRAEWAGHCRRTGKNHENYSDFCDWFDGVLVPSWLDPDPLDWDIEDGPQAEDLFTPEWFAKADAVPLPGKGQQDIFGGEVR